MLAGDQAAPADLDVGQVAAAHLVVEQVAGQAGQAGGLIDGVGQPPAGRVLAGPAARWCRRRAAPDLWCAGAGRLVQVSGRGAGAAGWSLSRLGVGPLAFPVVLLARAAGLGGPVDRVGSGQAEFGGPALDERPEVVLLVQVSVRWRGRRGSWR